VILDLLCHVARAKDDFPDTLSPNIFEQDLEKRNTGDHRHRLRPIAQNRAQTRPETAAEHKGSQATVSILSLPSIHHRPGR
jgi:hypothetical protein